MKKEDIPVVGKIIATKIKEIDTSTVVNQKEYTLEESIKTIEGLFQYEEDKADMNIMIQHFKDSYKKG